MIEPCIGQDPLCPCQDGDACHYKDAGSGKTFTPAFPLPVLEPPLPTSLPSPPPPA